MACSGGWRVRVRRLPYSAALLRNPGAHAPPRTVMKKMRMDTCSLRIFGDEKKMAMMRKVPTVERMPSDRKTGTTALYDDAGSAVALPAVPLPSPYMRSAEDQPKAGPVSAGSALVGSIPQAELISMLRQIRAMGARILNNDASWRALLRDACSGFVHP